MEIEQVLAPEKVYGKTESEPHKNDTALQH
jgi:hypothetical protein